jgi:hypothetical protein
MPTSSRRSPKGGKSPDTKKSGGSGKGGAGKGERQRNPDADPVRIHREYVQKRLGGGELPTPDAYERALDQWHNLAGAVRGPAGELHPEAIKGAAQQRSGEQELVEEAPGDAKTPKKAKTAKPEAGEVPLPATDPGDNTPYSRRAR